MSADNLPVFGLVDLNGIVHYLSNLKLLASSPSRVSNRATPLNQPGQRGPTKLLACGEETTLDLNTLGLVPPFKVQ